MMSNEFSNGKSQRKIKCWPLEQLRGTNQRKIWTKPRFYGSGFSIRSFGKCKANVKKSSSTGFSPRSKISSTAHPFIESGSRDMLLAAATKHSSRGKSNIGGRIVIKFCFTSNTTRFCISAIVCGSSVNRLLASLSLYGCNQIIRAK